MPYVIQEDRDCVDSEINKLIQAIRFAPSQKLGGVLNYTICRLSVGVLDPKGYSDTSDMLGHVHSAETEMRRRLLDPYEDECILRNGDLKEFNGPCS